MQMCLVSAIIASKFGKSSLLGAAQQAVTFVACIYLSTVFCVLKASAGAAISPESCSPQHPAQACLAHEYLCSILLCLAVAENFHEKSMLGLDYS